MRRLAIALAVFAPSAAFAAAADAQTDRPHPVPAPAASAEPDQVIQWNRTLLQILQTPGAQPATVHPTRSLAIAQLAVYDAVNAIEGGHAPYAFQRPAPRSASPDAAARSR
jgi:hypothetical protein